MSFVKLSDEINARNPLFLDTSIHCSQHKGTPFRSRIAEVFKRFSWRSTSSYTKVEFGNVILSCGEYYLNLLKEKKSLAAAKDWIGNVLPHNTPSGRKYVKWSFNLLNAMGEDDKVQTERATLSLQRLMKFGVKFVDAICDKPIEDGTGCYWARKGVHTTKHGDLQWETPNCKRTKRKCHLDTFFNDHRNEFENIKKVIDSLPQGKVTDQLKGFSEVIEGALENPASLLDYRSGCRRLADAIIAVESRKYLSLFSQNSAESSVLCQIFKQDFYYLPPNDEKGVLVQLCEIGQSSGT